MATGPGWGCEAVRILPSEEILDRVKCEHAINVSDLNLVPES